MGKRLPSIKLTASDQTMLSTAGFTIGKPFNSGEYGIVYEATRRVAKKSLADASSDFDSNGEVLEDMTAGPSSGQEDIMVEVKCAVKVINMSADKVDRKDLCREIFMMNRIKHQHVVEVYEMFNLAPSHLAIFMEYAEGGDLCELLAEERSWLDEYRASQFYRQFGGALSYMHILGFAHRDMKLENVLLMDKERTITKLTDFGFARSTFNEISGKPAMAHTWCGTVDYMPPEMLAKAVAKPISPALKRNSPPKSKKHSISYDAIKADVWSSGVLLFLLLNDDFPFGGQGKEREMARMQCNREYVYFNRSLSDGAKEVIDMHLEPDPARRPTIDKILKHPWFDEECWS